MIFWEIAKRNLTLHPLRSGLAMLGIIIGVVAIASMGILGNSMLLSISENLNAVGDSVIVTPYSGTTITASQASNPHGPSNVQMTGPGTTLSITDHNFQEIKRVSAPNRAIPVLQGSDRVKIGGDDTTATIYGIDPADLKYLVPLATGDYLRGSDSCLVGEKFAADHHVVIGTRIQMGENGGKGTLRVVGIIKERGMSFDISTDYAIVVSKEWFDEKYARSDYDSVVVKVKNQNDIASIKAAIEKALNRNRNQQIVTVMDTRTALDSILATFTQISTFVTIIGGISLLVSGISILNIMTMSVTERVKEIGIMRSIGAEKYEVMRMFLYEALILGTSGSIIGGVLSLAGGFVISNVMLNTAKFVFVPSSLINVISGVGFGIAISLICSLYPAWTAANLKPIEALRHE